MFQNNTNTSTKIVENASQIKDVVWDSINNLLNSLVGRLPYIIAGIVVLLIFYFLAKLIRAIFWSASKRTSLDNRLRILFSRIIGVFVIILGIFTCLTVIIPSFNFGDLIAGLGFTSFVVGFATKDILNNLLSGVLILWQQPFQIGDYVFIGSNQGKVEYIGVRATRLRKDDGELVLIPNGDMYSNALTIRSAGAERRMILKINIDYNADIAQTKQLISNVLNKSEGVVEEPQPKVVVTDLTSDGINLSIYFWINTDKNSPMAVLDEVATEIKIALSGNGIVMFPPGSMIVQSADSQNDSTQKSKKDVF